VEAVRQDTTAKDRFQVLMIDPANYSPHYDIPLCDALVAAGVYVRLVTSRFAYEASSDTVREYVDEGFYRAATGLRARGRCRQVLCGLEHGFDWLGVLRRVATARVPVIVHSQWLPVPLVDLWFLTAARRAGAALVHTVHNLKPNLELRGTLRQCEALYTIADCLIAHTSRTAEGLVREFGVPPTKILRIRHGTIGDQYAMVSRAEARERLRLGREDRVALFFGALRQQKGLQNLIAAFPAVLARCPAAKLLIAGRPEGLSASDVRALREAAGIPPERVVSCLEYIPTSDVPVYFGAADVVVCPYTQADQSGALILGLTLGRPAVVSDVGGLPEIVQHGVHGLVTPAGDVAALAGAVAELVCEPEKARQMGEAGRRMALEEWGWGAVAGQTLEAYRLALAMRGLASTGDAITNGGAVTVESRK